MLFANNIYSVFVNKFWVFQKFKSTSINQGWTKISLVVILFLGSTSKIHLIKCVASFDISLTGAYSPLIIKSCKSLILFPLNGTVPLNIAYNTTPADHISTPKPSYPLFNNISGAIYAGVPHCSNIDSLFLISLLTPKSQILILLSKSIKILSNFISLWTILWSWIYCNVKIICLNINFATCSVNLPLFLI